MTSQPFRPPGRTYGGFFLLLLLIFVLLPFTDERWARILIVLSLAGVLALSPRVSHGGRRARLAFAILAVVIGAAALGTLESGTTAGGYSRVLLAGASLIAAVTIVRRIFDRDEVTGDTILAALCTYLLLGYAFAFTFAALDAWSDGAFFAQDVDTTRLFPFFYFSFVTITTLGYGDLSPALETGQALASAEALSGQLLLVVLVGFLVSRFRRERRSDNGAGDESA